MRESTSPTPRRLHPLLGVLASLPAWAGLAYVVTNSDPRQVSSRFLFLVVLFLAQALTFTPLFNYLERRAARAPHFMRAARRGGLASLFLVLCAWLRMNQALTEVNALLLLAALVLTEAFLWARST
ncbi:MAG: hypothetical protein HYZ68_05580 [Chloroflexi bacterium]|nr:hypothetical protein [Chloroflexota bacterium]